MYGYGYNPTLQYQARLQQMQQYQPQYQPQQPIPPQQYQPMQYQPTQQQQYQQAQQPNVLKGRVVSGVEEARAAQIDLDGTPTYFDSPADGKIFKRFVDLNGNPVTIVFGIVKDEPRTSASDTIVALEARVAQLEAILGGITNVQSDGNDGKQSNFSRSTNGTGKQQSNATASATTGKQPAVRAGYADG